MVGNILQNLKPKISWERSNVALMLKECGYIWNENFCFCFYVILAQINDQHLGVFAIDAKSFKGS